MIGQNGFPGFFQPLPWVFCGYTWRFDQGCYLLGQAEQWHLKYFHIPISLSLHTHTHTHTPKTWQKGLWGYDEVKDQKMGSGCWMILAGPIQSHESLKAEQSSWLWWAGEMTKQQWPVRCHFAGFEDGGGKPQAKECRWALETRKGKKIQILPWKPLKGIVPCWYPNFTPEGPTWNSDLQD